MQVPANRILVTALRWSVGDLPLLCPFCDYLAKVTQPARGTDWDSNPIELQSLQHYAKIYNTASVFRCIRIAEVQG